MESNDFVSAFDRKYTNNHIQILKALMPFMDTKGSTMLPVLIKYMELKHTLASWNNIRSAGMNFSEDTSQMGNNIENIYNAICRYLSPSEDKSIASIVNASKTMENVKMMQSMMEFMDINMGDMAGNGFDINEIMKMFGGNVNDN